MTIEENKALVRQFFAGLDTGSAAVLDEVCAPNYQLHFPLSPVPLDLQNAKPFFQTLLNAFPGIKHSIEDMLGEGSKVVVRLAINGVHNGELMGIPPSGKPMSVVSINIMNIENGAIVEQWVEFDALGMMQQIGAIPSPQG
jgi:ketosteroid isomerase-like protein